MNSSEMPAITAVDALTQALAAACYLAVALPVAIRWWSDIRARVFLAFAAANAVAFAAPAVAWQQGAATLLDLPRWTLALLLAGLAEAALLLFHFAQVFPRRRPWIRTAGVQMAVAYVLVPAAIATLVLYAPADVASVTGGYVALTLIFGFPLMVLLAIVLPVAAIVSLIRSYVETGRQELAPARVPIALILVGQVAGGALALIFAPILATVAPGGRAELALTLVMWLLTLITPLAFALAAWRYGVLAIDPE